MALSNSSAYSYDRVIPFMKKNVIVSGGINTQIFSLENKLKCAILLVLPFI